jgi:hypothetical protein
MQLAAPRGHSELGERIKYPDIKSADFSTKLISAGGRFSTANQQLDDEVLDSPGP